MPFTFTNYQPLTPEQASPLNALVSSALNTYGQVQKLGQSQQLFPEELRKAQLANAISQVQANYAGPMAAQELQKAKLANQYYAPDIQSQISLRNAQAGLAGQETQWYGQKAKAEIALQQAQAQQAGVEALQSQLKYNFLKSQLPSGNASATATNTQGTNAGSPSAAPSVAPQAQAYGIATPQPTQSDIVNQILFGIDTFSPRKDNAKTQQQEQYTAYQSAITDAVKESVAANNLNQAMGVFNQAMDKSFYKGSRLGHISSSGIFSPPGDMSPEQEADRSALQMLPSAIETLRDAMGTARFSNLDMNMSSKMKFDRTMTDEARELQTKWIGGINDRMMEKPKFYAALANTQLAKKADADLLWAAYQQDFPLISQDGKTFQGSNLGNWPLYTTPKAISSIQTTGSYRPSSKEKSVFMMQVPDGKGGFVVAPVKKGRVESAFRKGAKPL